jgi:hypothetical protein
MVPASDLEVWNSFFVPLTRFDHRTYTLTRDIALDRLSDKTFPHDV